MRHNCLRFICLFLLSALAIAQAPRIGLIDFYGRRKVPETQVRKALGAQEGDPLPRSKSDVEEAMEKIPNVTRARLEAVCCDSGKAILYIGIEEKGAPHFDYNSLPSGEMNLPPEVHEEYAGFLGAVNQAVRSGQTSENLRQGHSLMNHPEVRAHQEKFLELAKTHLKILKDVLRNSADEEQRAMAAYIAGYVPKKEEVVNDLQYALRDPDDTVRNNAMRALSAIAVLASQEPGLGIKVAPTWFIEMLDSLIWQDRTAAAVALVTLTETRDARVLDHLRERALPSLLEMARWKHLPHALPSFILAGRIAGIPEAEIQEAWKGGDREALLKRVSGEKK